MSDQTEPRVLLTRYLLEALEGKREFSDRRLIGVLGIVLHEQLPKPIAESVLMLTSFKYAPIGDGAMAVELDTRTRGLTLRIDLRYMDALMRLGQSVYTRESCHLLHHELAHILLGHLDGPVHEFSDPMMILAKEIAVNDGWLRLGDTVYPFVRLDGLAFADAVRSYAEQNHYPPDWLQRYLLVYRALVHAGGSSAYIPRGELENQIRLWGAEHATVHDHTGHLPQDARVLVVYDGTEVHVYPVVELRGSGSIEQSQLLRDIHEAIKESLLEDGHYRYDTTTHSFHYSPHGYTEDERLLKMTGYRVPWHKIRQIFGVRRSLGYDRRRGHLYPPDEAPLVTNTPKRKTVDVFYDSSGSVPDEILGGFVGTMKRSPFRIREHYFSTVVTDKPHTGGTDFKCIEDYLLQQDEYPDTVIVLTDGYAQPNFTPKYPDRWNWIVYGDPRVPQKIGGQVIVIEKVESFV